MPQFFQNWGAEVQEHFEITINPETRNTIKPMNLMYPGSNHTENFHEHLPGCSLLVCVHLFGIFPIRIGKMSNIGNFSSECFISYSNGNNPFSDWKTSRQPLLVWYLKAAESWNSRSVTTWHVLASSNLKQQNAYTWIGLWNLACTQTRFMGTCFRRFVNSTQQYSSSCSTKPAWVKRLLTTSREKKYDNVPSSRW